MPERPGPLLAPSDLDGTEGWVILDCRAGPERGGYDRAHLVGSHRADLETDLSAPGDPAVGGRHPLPPLLSWAATLGRWGIGPETRVLVVDAAGGGLYAARAWWMLRAVGHDRVWVLDGGYSAAVDAGWPTDDAIPPPAEGEPYPVEAWTWPMAEVEEVDRARTDPDWRVIDARAAPRWRGEIEPLDPVPGRIPGSVNWPWESAVVDGRLADPEALRIRLDALLGDVPDERVIVHCGSGVTACHTLLALEAAGRGPAALYVGSYSAWCRQDRPIATGP